MAVLASALWLAAALSVKCAHAAMCYIVDPCGEQGIEGKSYSYDLLPGSDATFSLPHDACNGQRIIGFSATICWPQPAIVLPLCQGATSFHVKKETSVAGMVKMAAYCATGTTVGARLQPQKFYDNHHSKPHENEYENGLYYFMLNSNSNIARYIAV